MNIVAIQPKIDLFSTQITTAQRCDKLAYLIASCVENSAIDIELVVLPELCTVDYSEASFSALAEIAEEEQGATFNYFSRLAKRLGIAISFSIATRNHSKFYISNLVVNSHGELISRYNKVHLAQLGASHERDYFACGHAFGAFELADYRFGVLLCYDFRFPNYVHTLCQKFNVEVLLHPVAFCKDETYPTWHKFAIARAVENQVYFLSVNRAGEHWGQTIICPPWVDATAKPSVLGEEESSEVLKLSKMEIEEVRSKYPLRRDQHSDYDRLDAP